MFQYSTREKLFIINRYKDYYKKNWIKYIKIHYDLMRLK